MNNNQQQQAPQPQQYLFYSQNYCEHSKRFISLLNKNGLNNSVILCNIDNQDLKIPPFITSVPTLYLSNERQVLTGEKLFEWINDLVQKQTQKSSVLTMQDITGSNDIHAFHQNELGSSNDIGYAFLDDNANDMMATSFEMLDGSNKDKLTMPGFTRMEGVQQSNNQVQNTNNEKEQRQKELNNAYDQLMAARNAEMQSLPMNQRV